MEFTQKLIAIQRNHPNLHRRKFYQDRSIRGTAEKDIVWLRPDGQEMSDEEWGFGLGAQSRTSIEWRKPWAMWMKRASR